MKKIQFIVENQNFVSLSPFLSLKSRKQIHRTNSLQVQETYKELEIQKNSNNCFFSFN